ncbi:MAG: sulfotransferase domain-containing protein [Chloroflexota bacterium]
MESRVVGRVARGSKGAGPARRIYRRSPLRWLRNSVWAKRGLRSSDVFLASYPRSGSSWIRFLIMEMFAGEASFEDFARTVPEIGRHQHARALLPGGGRFIKTHEHFSAGYRRAIHLVRDPRDVAVSYFRYMQRIQKIVLRPGDDEAASFDCFIDALLAGRIDGFGTWQAHLLSWLDAAESRRVEVLRLRFEDLRADPVSVTLAIARFLGLELSAVEAELVAQRSSIEQMRAAEEKAIESGRSRIGQLGRRSGVRLINSGSVEGWREKLTADQLARFEAFAEGLARMGYAPAVRA